MDLRLGCIIGKNAKLTNFFDSPLGMVVKTAIRQSFFVMGNGSVIFDYEWNKRHYFVHAWLS